MPKSENLFSGFCDFQIQSGHRLAAIAGHTIIGTLSIIQFGTLYGLFGQLDWCWHSSNLVATWWKTWKMNGSSNFSFSDCQLKQAINSEDEIYVKRKIRKHMAQCGTYLLLFGDDTIEKTTYVYWEAKIAIENRKRLIVANHDNSIGFNNWKCPYLLKIVGAIFIPFSQSIIQFTLEKSENKNYENWVWPDRVYKKLGYSRY